MSSLWNFTVGCSSPMWYYEPFDGGVDATISWVPLCGGGDTRCDDGAAYMTSLNQASLSLSFQGSSIALYGNLTGTMSLAATLDSGARGIPGYNAKDQLLVQFGQLAQGAHNVNVTFSPLQATDAVHFTHAVISVDTGIPNVNVTSIYIDDLSSQIDYLAAGNWTTQPNFKGTVSPSTYNSTTYHQTKVYNGAAQALFNGSAVLIYGPCYNETGAYSTNIPTDGPVSWANGTFASLGNSVFENCLRYFQAGLSPNITHKLTYVNMDQTGLATDLDYIEVFTFAPSNSNGTSGSSGNSGNSTAPYAAPSSTVSSNNVGAIVGGTIGGVAFVVFIGALAFFLWRRKRQARPLVLVPFDLAQHVGVETEPKTPATSSTPGFTYARERRERLPPPMAVSAGGPTGTTVPPQAPSLDPILVAPASPPVPPVNSNGFPELSAISSDVNRILAQLTQLGRRSAPEPTGQVVHEGDGSVASFPTTLPQYDHNNQ